MAKKRATINISLQAKSQLDSVKSSGQSYDGIIRQLVKFYSERRVEQRGGRVISSRID